MIMPVAAELVDGILKSVNVLVAIAIIIIIFYMERRR